MPPRKSLLNGGKPASTASNASVNRAIKRSRPSLDGKQAVKSTASLPGTASDADELEEDEDEVVVAGRKSTSASPVRKRKSTESTSEDEATDEELDVQTGLLARRTKSGKDNTAAAPASAASTRRTRSASSVKPASAKKIAKPASRAKVPESAGKVVRRGGKSSKKTTKSKSKSKSTTAEDSDSEDENDNVRTVRSTSARGYNWDVEVIHIPADEVATRLTYHDVIKTTLERDGENIRVKFKTGDWIFVAPDPHYLPPRSEEIDLEELADDEWWVAEIVSACSLPQVDAVDLGVLKVRWAYSKDDVLRKETEINPSYKKRLAEYRMDEDERILSDHTDFCAIDAYAGDASGLYHFLTISGMKVEDRERMIPHIARKVDKKRKPTKILGWNAKQKFYEGTGEEVAADSDEESARPAKKSPKKPASKKKPSSIASKTAPASNKKPTSVGKKASAATAKKSTSGKNKR